MNVTDMLGRKLAVGDYIVFHNVIYRVKELPGVTYTDGSSRVKIMLMNPSRTTKPVTKDSKDMFLIHKEDVTEWILRGK